MEYQEAATILAALAICTEQVKVGCEQCPAYKEDQDGRKQRQACNDMLEPGKVAEAIGLVSEYNRIKEQQGEAPDGISN